ncbi:MAG: hypothetical protein GOV02_02950 [Candidatus Aenigmarchaeota archaeon]|nr:hypothetical protein [Candidatus Aenigmarchaeota archaeon]
MVKDNVVKSEEFLAKLYFIKLQKKEWNEVAKLYTPEALKEFKSMITSPLEASSVEFPEEFSAGLFEGLFGSEKTIEDIKEMSDIDFFANFLRNSVEMASEAGGGVDFKSLNIIGSVSEGDSICHILARMYVEVGEMEFEKLEILSVKKIRDTWGIILQGQVKGMAKQFVKMFDHDSRLG